MKKIVQSFAYIIALLLLFAACEESAIDPLTGKYPAPTEYTLSSLLGQSMVKQKNGSRIFTVMMGTDGVTSNYDEASQSYSFSGDGHFISINLIGKQYFLDQGTYGVATNDKAKAGNYIAGSDNSGTQFFTVSGSTTSPLGIIGGNIWVEMSPTDSSFYEISGTLTLSDESLIRIDFQGNILYEPDVYIPTYTYTDEKVTPALGGAQGTTPIDGSTMHKLTIYADDVMFAYLEVVADANAASIAGTYTIKDGINAIGQINNGYYLDFTWWGGAGTMEGGTYYIEDEQKMFIREGAGVITIVDNDGKLTITGTNLGILDVPTLISSKGTTWTNLGTTGSINIITATNTGGNGPEPVASFTYTNTITAPATYGFAGTAIEGSQLNVITISDAAGETVGVVELITAEGTTDFSGDYAIVDGTATTPVIGNANNGFYVDLTWYGMDGISIGGCYYIENGENKYIRTGSTIHVTDNGGVLSISGDNLAILDLDALVASNGATWSILETAGSFSFANVSPGN